MAAASNLLSGGELNAAVTSALVGIHSRHLGRGPRTATTFYKDNVIVTLMYDVMTQAEKTLAENRHGDAVTSMRHLFQETMEADFTAAVKRLTGQKVVAFISGNNTQPDVASELFVLEHPINPPATTVDPAAAIDAREN